MAAIERVQDGPLWFHPDTGWQVRSCLIRAFETKDRVRLFYGHTDTGAAWPEEHDTIGRVGRSTGLHKVPLLIANARSMGGGAILDHCVVAILRRDGVWLYRHPSFTLGDWQVRERPRGGAMAWEVLNNGAVYSRHEVKSAADKLCAFMQGRRWSK